MKTIKDWVKNLPERKKYIDVVTAIMSVPILLTVMMTNITNLAHKNETNASEKKPTPVISEVIKVVPIEVHTTSTTSQKIEVTNTPTPTIEVNKNVSVTANPTLFLSCKKEVGPASIVSPSENETVKNDPVCIDISYKSGEYCSVTWSYRMDEENWSEYMDKSICIHNITNGSHKLELRIKSTTSADEILLIRNFTYTGQTSVTATATIEPTSSVSTSSATTN